MTAQTALMAIYRKGRCEGRCDGRCWGATSPPSACTCICGGINHGVGRQQAVENTAEVAKVMQAALAPGWELRLDERGEQLAIL